MSWLQPIDLSMPYWADYLPYLQQLEGPAFPECGQLNALLPAGLTSHGGHTIHFVPSTDLIDTNYEQRIYTTGQVSTRSGNWHDLFNALVWARFPSIKTTMNALHCSAFDQGSRGSRGKLRDALTLFDECGVIVFAHTPVPLARLMERRWSELYRCLEIRWGEDIQLTISGHAILEKYLAPYKSMTAKALLVQTEPDCISLTRDKLLRYLDTTLAKRMLATDILAQPACLAPLPLAGVPGWWSEDEQDDPFYDDPDVFRPPPATLKTAQVVKLP